LDIAENGITAGADRISIRMEEARARNLLTIVITDNGRGIPVEKLAKLRDPFVTSRKTRRVGLGLPLLAAAAERCEGKLEVATEAGAGTKVVATFRYDHIDRAPVGDMAATITTLIIGNPEINFVYTHLVDDNEFTLDTRELRAELGDASLSDPVVIHHLTASIRNSLRRLASAVGNSEVKETKDGKTDD
jgi:hypothetical protein